MAETKRVIYYDQLDNNRPSSGDVIFVDNPNTGTHKMDLKSFVDAINNGFNNSIKSSGVSVSADNYSSIITNVNDQPVNSIYTYGAGLQSKVSNLPSNKAMTIINFAQKSTGGLGQVMLAVERNGSDDYLYFRTIGGSPAVWSSWVKVANNSDVEAVREALDNLDIETDKTLSIDGKPADAKAAGDAIDDLKADLNLLATITKPEEINLSSYPYQQGYLGANGVFIATTGINAQKTTNAIPLSAGNYKVTFKGQNVNDGVYFDVNYVRAIAVYNSNDECTAYLQTANLENFTVGQNDSYVRINVQYVVVTTYTIHKTDEEVTASINDDVSIPTDSTLTEISKPANAKAVGDAIKAINIPQNWYMPARRPIIAFNFDGTYNMNMRFKQLFDAHDVKCGYALPYTTTFPYNATKEDYLSLQDNGFEIIVHSAVAVGTQSSATDEEIRQIVRDSYDTLTGYGFKPHGFVAYQGNAKQVAIDESQRLLDYAATVNNHAGNLTGDLSRSNIYFTSDPPYKLWRYSMQSSTLDQMKAAVDECYNTNGFLWFYGHANESQLNNMTIENIDVLLTYIEGKGIPILTPYEAIKDFYTVRPQDIVS